MNVIHQHIQTVRNLKGSNILTFTSWPLQAPQEPILVVESIYGLFDENNVAQQDLNTVFNLFQYEVSAVQNYKQLWNQLHSRYLKDLAPAFKRTASLQLVNVVAKSRALCQMLLKGEKPNKIQQYSTVLYGLKDLNIVEFTSLEDFNVTNIEKLVQLQNLLNRIAPNHTSTNFARL